MFELELHEIRAAELRRRADDARLVREAVRSRRAARREEAARQAAVPEEVHTGRPSRRRLPGTV
ncbi:hypothetical protein ABT075_39110 [Streptomyces sp. NPDC002677]|uniref:hypothetical protein n=1 Tax=Streptomyces sp. NPDC002677 TaxID=3154774 RepID=UPI00331FD72B